MARAGGWNMKAWQSWSLLAITSTMLLLIVGQAPAVEEATSGRSSPSSLPTPVAKSIVPNEDVVGAGQVAPALDRSIGEMVDLITTSKSEVDKSIRSNQSHRRLDQGHGLGQAASGRAPAVVDEELVINPSGSNINEGMAPKAKVDEKGALIQFSATGERSLSQ